MESDIREGFLCPICVQDLKSFHKLQEHFETSHTAEDKAVLDQIKGLFSKAKGRLLKRDETVATSHLQTNQYTPQLTQPIPDWEPQELGVTRSRVEVFKKIRDARIDRFVIESNKVLIRLDKLIIFNDLDKAKRKEFEQTLVPWVKDEDVPFCPTCGDRFILTRRRHHCRLCGAIMCTKCSLFVSLGFADQLVQTLKRSSVTERRSRSLTNLSRPSVADQEINIRCCRECYKVLVKRKQKIDDKVNQPLLVFLYEKLQSAIDSSTKLAPDYQRMADSLNHGEEDYDLNRATDLRFKLIKLYETVDVVSKKIASLDVEDEENPPSATVLRLHRSIRQAAHAYLQENMLTLQSLPSLPKLEILQKERRKEQERKLRKQMEEAERERAEAKRMQELERLKQEREEVERKSSGLRKQPSFGHRKQLSGSSLSSTSSRSMIILDDGWSSSAHVQKVEGPRRDDVDGDQDPLLEQISYVKQMISQARSANREEEVKSLSSHLEELKREYHRQKTALAFSSAASPVPATNHTVPTYQNPFLEDSDKSLLVTNTNPFLEEEHGNPFLTTNGSVSNNPFLKEKNPFLHEDSPSDHNSRSPDSDPMFQQICYISQCLDEATRLGKKDEVAILQENLRELQALYNSGRSNN